MRTCTACGADKPPSEFYAKHSNCKDCTKARVRAYRAANLERVRAYDRLRGNLPHRVEARAAYACTPQGLERLRAGSRRWIERNPEKRAAHCTVSNALQKGKLVRQPCQVCGEAKTQAHHDDYSRPLEVRWLCTPCHAEHHKEARAVSIPFRAEWR